MNLRAGDWVEVRSKEEILATLDSGGRLANLPFMPEMLEYCGRRMRVSKRADKTCDYIGEWSIRRMDDTVHLEACRCDGSAHDGCQAACLIFWKEAWLKKIARDTVPEESLLPSQGKSAPAVFTAEQLLAASASTNPQNEKIYSCQCTDVPKFTSSMSKWDPRQYVRDVRSGNLDSGLADGTRGQRALETVLGVLQVLRAIAIGAFNDLRTKRRRTVYPLVRGEAATATIERLELQPGELVEVRSREEILATLDASQRHRGLWFDSEMLPYCGGIYRVLRRVHRIIEEKTGKMVNMKHPCIILEGVVCRSDFHRLCPRAIYPYWRENWLRRADVTSLRDHVGAEQRESTRAL